MFTFAGEDEEYWVSKFKASGNFENIETPLAGLGGMDAIQKIYVAHTAEAISKQ